MQGFRSRREATQRGDLPRTSQGAPRRGKLSFYWTPATHAMMIITSPTQSAFTRSGYVMLNNWRKHKEDRRGSESDSDAFEWFFSSDSCSPGWPGEYGDAAFFCAWPDSTIR